MYESFFHPAMTRILCSRPLGESENCSAQAQHNTSNSHQSTIKTHSQWRPKGTKQGHKKRNYSPSQGKMKRVSFSEEMTTFRAVISIDNMTKNEREAVWVTPQRRVRCGLRP
jgi:hypothetical protein